MITEIQIGVSLGLAARYARRTSGIFVFGFSRPLFEAEIKPIRAQFTELGLPAGNIGYRLGKTEGRLSFLFADAEMSQALSEASAHAVLRMTRYPTLQRLAIDGALVRDLRRPIHLPL